MTPKEASRSEPQPYTLEAVENDCGQLDYMRARATVEALDAARAEAEARLTEAEVRELVREAFTQGYELGGCDSEGHRIYRLETVRGYFLDDASIGFASYIARIRAARGPR